MADSFMCPLRGKLAIITGASRGIGAAIAENLASKGCDLVLNYASPSSTDPTDSLCKSLQERFGITAVPIQVDMGTPTGPGEIISFAIAKFSSTHTHPGTTTGQLKIDIIINNAGISHNKYLPEITIDDFNNHYNINVLGPLLLIQAALPYLPHDRSGRVVNLSSVSSSQGFHAQSIYGGTKAALEAMTRTWSRELAERATVNAVNPGPVDTDMYNATIPEFKARLRPFIEHAPLMAMDTSGMCDEEKKRYRMDGGRAATSKEIAGVVGMLCSAESGWCTGSVICANGGMVFSK